MEYSDMASVRELEGLDQFVEDMLQAWRVPGLALAIVRGQELILCKGYGLRDAEAGLPVTPRTLFPIASITKGFTAMTLAMLVDEGKLDWDRPIREYFPSFKMKDPFASENATVRDLLTHRTGLPQHDGVWYKATAPREELVRRLRYLDANAAFRTRPQYCNLGYVAAGHLAEIITGTSWESLVQDRILTPLGMNESTLSVLVAQERQDFAAPYAVRGGELRRIPFYEEQGPIGPSGAVVSTAEEMSRWLMLHLNAGRYNGSQIVSERQMIEMHTGHALYQRPTGQYPEMPQSSYGLGWAIEPYRGRMLVNHGGAIFGFSSLASLMPDDGLGVIVLANNFPTPVVKIVAYNVLERLLGLSQTSWHERLSAEAERDRTAAAEARSSDDPGRIPDTHPSHRPEEYTGNFAEPGHGALEISLREQHLVATMNSARHFSVHHRYYDIFSFYDELLDMHFPARFTTSFEGEIESVTILFDRQIAPITFVRDPAPSLNS